MEGLHVQKFLISFSYVLFCIYWYQAQLTTLLPCQMKLFRAIIVLGILNNFVTTGNSHKMLNNPKLMSFIATVQKTEQVSLTLWSYMFIILRVYLTNTYLCVMQRRNGNRKTDKLTEENVCFMLWKMSVCTWAACCSSNLPEMKTKT